LWAPLYRESFQIFFHYFTSLSNKTWGKISQFLWFLCFSKFFSLKLHTKIYNWIYYDSRLYRETFRLSCENKTILIFCNKTLQGNFKNFSCNKILFITPFQKKLFIVSVKKPSFYVQSIHSVWIQTGLILKFLFLL